MTWLGLVLALVTAPPSCDITQPRCVQDVADACLDLVRFAAKQPVSRAAAALCGPLWAGDCGLIVGELGTIPEARRLREITVACVRPEDCTSDRGLSAVCGKQADTITRDERWATLRLVLPRRWSPHLLPKQKDGLTAQLEDVIRMLEGSGPDVAVPALVLPSSSPPPPAAAPRQAAQPAREPPVPARATFVGTPATTRAAELAIELVPSTGKRTAAQLLALFAPRWPALVDCVPRGQRLRFVVEVPLSGVLVASAVDPVASAPCVRRWITGSSGRDILPKPERIWVNVTR